jgi:hypothetical protein
VYGNVILSFDKPTQWDKNFKENVQLVLVAILTSTYRVVHTRQFTIQEINQEKKRHEID